MLSQLSGDVSNAIASRIAIAGLTPDLPFSNSDNALRVTPRPLAATVTEMPSGWRHSSRITSPGCGGLYIAIAGTPLMIVDVVNVDYFPVLESKDDSPISACRHGPESRKRAGQPMKTQT